MRKEKTEVFVTSVVRSPMEDGVTEGKEQGQQSNSVTDAALVGIVTRAMTRFRKIGPLGGASVRGELIRDRCLLRQMER